MGENTNIEWTDKTWNPWHGCEKISPACKNCYMFTDKKRYGQDPTIIQRSKTTFYAPLKWDIKPARCFTCSWSDFFIEEADDWRDEAFAIMSLTPHITYQVLTKRAEQMYEYFAQADGFGPWGYIETHGKRILRERFGWAFEDSSKKTLANFAGSNLPNVWLGVSVEDKKRKQRIEILRSTPAAVRFLSIEPLLEDLGDLDLLNCSSCDGYKWVDDQNWQPDMPGMQRVVGDGRIPCGNCNHGGWINEDIKRYPIDWVIVGGESGSNARPMHPDWVRSIREQCVDAGVPFFFKQWGEWHPTPRTGDPKGLQLNKNGESATASELISSGRAFTVGWTHKTGCRHVEKVGKKKAGRQLDGCEWNEFPEVK